MAGERTQFIVLNVDTEVAFATANGSPSWSQLPAHNFQHTFKQEELTDDTYTVQRAEHLPIAGSKSVSTFSFDTHAAGIATVPGDGVAVTQTPLGKVMLAGFGTEQLSTEDITAGTPAVGAIDGTNAGDIITNTIAGFATPTNGTIWRPVTASGVTLTPIYELPEAPAVGAAIYATASYQWVDQVAEASSYQLQFLNESSDTNYKALGCFPTSMNLAVQPGQLGVWSISNVCADWTDGETGGAANLTTVTPSSKEAWINQHVEIIPFGTTTYAAGYLRALRDLTVTIDRTLQRRPDPNASQGTAMWEDNGSPVVTIDFTINVDDAWRDAFSSSYYTLIFSIGRTAGKANIFFARKCHLKAFPEETDQDGVMVTRVSMALTEGATSPSMIWAQG